MEVVWNKDIVFNAGRGEALIIAIHVSSIQKSKIIYIFTIRFIYLIANTNNCNYRCRCYNIFKEVREIYVETGADPKKSHFNPRF